MIGELGLGLVAENKPYRLQIARNKDSTMWVSPKKYILTANNEVKEAGPGVSGTVLVGEGAEIPEEEARRYGILDDGKQPSTPLPTSEPKASVVRDSQPLPKEINFGKVTEEKPEVKPWEKKAEETTALPAE